MSWEIATVVMIFSVPFTTIFMTNKQLEPEKNEHFWWIRLLMFMFNLVLIGLGLWVAQVIAVANNATVGALLETAWRAYTWMMSFVILLILILLGKDFFQAIIEKFPSLKERR